MNTQPRSLAYSVHLPTRAELPFLHRSRPDSRCKGVPDSTMVNASQDLAAFHAAQNKVQLPNKVLRFAFGPQLHVGSLSVVLLSEKLRSELVACSRVTVLTIFC